MFLNKTVFKKWVKEAYNGDGLKVGMVFDGFVLAGNFWCVWIDGMDTPNWVKALVIEHVGRLPEEDELFEARKGEPGRGLALEDFLNLPARFLEAKDPYVVTPVTCGGGNAAVRFLQNRQTKGIRLLREDYYRVIDFSNLNEDGRYENSPVGPSAINTDPYKYYWENERCALVLCGLIMNNEKTNEVAAQLSEIDFGEGVK